MAKRPKGATRHVTEAAPRQYSLRWLVTVMLGVVVVIGGYFGLDYLQDPGNLPVRKVRIESPLKQVTQQQLRDVIEVHAKQGFVGLDVDEIRSELEAMPWVYRATVRRGWPDVLIVRVEEEQAVARWAAGGLLSRRGELFEPENSKAWTQLPLLRGPTGTERTVAEKYREMIDMLTPLGLKVSHLTMDERRAWNLRLSNSLQMVLGRDDTHLRLLRFVRVYADVLKPRLEAIDSVDLRYTNGFAVRWREGYAPAAA